MNFLDLKDVIISELNGGSGVINFPDHSNEHGIDVNLHSPDDGLICATLTPIQI
jgi:hypothetical protein